MEVEQRADGICDVIKRSMSDALAVEPIIFDEANHRGLIGGRMIHEVVLRPRRNNKQRLPWTVSAPPLSVRSRGIEAGRRWSTVAPETRARGSFAPNSCSSSGSEFPG